MAFGDLARFLRCYTKPNACGKVDGYNPLAVIDAYRRKLPIITERKTALSSWMSLLTEFRDTRHLTHLATDRKKNRCLVRS